MTDKEQEQIEKLEKKKSEIERKIKVLKDKDNQVDTLIIKTPYGKIEIQKQIHHKNKPYKECEEDCPKGWEIATYEILQWLRNSEYIERLNLRETWEFVQNPDEISKKNNYIARFGAYSDWAVLNCGGDPTGSDGSLGVRYFRRLNGK